MTKRLIKPYFLLFSNLEDKQIEAESAASSFQSFETATLLIGSNRWPAAITTVWAGIEQMLRVHWYRSRGRVPERTVTSEELQKDFDDYQNVSADLRKSVEALRQKRNDFSHKGFSPRDDSESIELFFGAGLSYFKLAVERTLSCSVGDLIPEANAWFWEILHITRDAVKSTSGHPNEAKMCLVLFQHAAQKVFSVGSANETLFPINLEREALWAAEDWDALYATDVMIKKYMISEIGESFHIEGAPCLICGSDIFLSAGCFDYEPEPNSAWDKNFDLRGLWCANCRYCLTSEPLVKKIIKKKGLRSKLDSIYLGKVDPYIVPYGAPNLE